MVEAGANEIPEAEILDALDIAHGEIKKLCALQRELAEKVGKPKLEVVVPQVDPGLLDAVKRLARRGARRGDAGRGQARAPGRQPRPSRPRSLERTPATPTPRATPSSRAAAQLAFDKLEKSIIRERIAVHKKRPDGRRENEIRDDHDRGRRRPAHARLGAVHARPDAGAQRRRARHAQGGDAPRHARPRDEEVLLPPLQLPAVLGRGGGPPRRPEAPRHRPRRARRARAGADGPVDRGLPLHDPRRLGHPRVQRLVVDGLGLRLVAVADGRRRADQATGRGHRDGPDQGGRRLHRPHRHRRRRGSPRRHGLQGRRHRARASPRCRWTSRSRASRSTSCATRSTQAKEARTVHPRQDGRGHRRAARGAQPVRAADPDDQDRPDPDRPADRQGRRDDPRPVARSSSPRSTSTTTARC